MGVGVGGGRNRPGGKKPTGGRTSLLHQYAPSKCSDLPVHLTILDPVVQSLVSLTSSLVVKMLTVLIRTILNSQVFFLIKCE